MKTFLYIDGFNIYYSAVKETPLRWLNPVEHAASFYHNGLTWSQLEHAQFPNPLTDAQGTFQKPPTW
jgi:hypothetical protein